MPDLAFNVRRLMARQGMTLDDLVEASGLDQRTIGAVLASGKRPHARTLNKLATGLGVESDELFQSRAWLSRADFDRKTNPLVEEVAGEHPEWFLGWEPAHFEQLSSQFGTGGPLTREGVVAATQSINRQREVQTKVALLLESGQGELLAELVEVLYRRITVRPR